MKSLKGNNDTTTKYPRLSGFLITTFTAIAVASIDTGVFLFLPENLNRVVVIGIITFFGLLIVSAHHEHAKKRRADKTPSEAGATPKEGKGSDASKSSDGQNGPGKWEGEIMRTSIAGTLILLYVIVIAATIFPTNLIYPCESGSADKSLNSSSTANAVKESTTCQTILNNFGNVIIVVVGFYFGSKAAIQIYQNYKGSQGSTDTDTTKTTK